MNLSVSLVVSTYNWPQALRLCLKSINNQSRMPDEIIVADDGSGVVTKELIDDLRKEFKVPLHHIWQEDIGFRKSLILNKAVKAASSDYIIQIDGDVILDENFVKDHLSVAEERTFIRGTRAHLRTEILPDIFKKQLIHFSIFDKGIQNRFNAIRLPALAWMFTKKRRCSKSVRGCNVAFWKSDFVSVNGYSNDLQGWGHEDEELAARMVHSGILRKGLKFKAVQYHISHHVSSRNQSSKHRISLRKTLEVKLKRCRNGYQEVQSAAQIPQFEMR